MTRDGSRVQRFAKTWLGPSLATLVGIGSTVELAAMPIPAAGVHLPGPTLIQQSPGPEQPATPPPPSADESKPDSFTELHDALEAARQRLEELSKAADAVAATGQLRQELAALREENQKLRAEIDAVRADRGELETTKQAAEARAAELTKTVEQATAKAQTEAEAQLRELRDSLQRAEQEKARIGADLTEVQAELATDKEQVAAAGQQHAQIEQRAAALESERDDLRTRLADVTARLGWSEAAKAQLEMEIGELRKAAGTAADDARQNLIAVENRIKELNEALAAIGPAAAPLETDAALAAGSGTPAAGQQAEGRAAAAPAENVAAVAAPSQSPEPGIADAALQQAASAPGPREIEGAHLDQRGVLGGRPAVFQMLADLPAEKRPHVQGLLADLHSQLDERGLITTVPGELLFAVNSDEVEVSAYGTLAKIAELIRMYGDRQVLIIGHSDARGDAARNRELSERRAERIKQIFVGRFDLAAGRLATEGVGAARPVASNATAQGRQANRRVEVLILN
jgi:outer membrane protein OmpA-like peptidoglycan-associated protein/predicted  nucleic acid-binding Zn-ribbon protein